MQTSISVLHPAYNATPGKPTFLTTHDTLEEAEADAAKIQKRHPTAQIILEHPCHVCGVLISKDELDENGAYSYPEGLPHCPLHYDEELGTD